MNICIQQTWNGIGLEPAEEVTLSLEGDPSMGFRLTIDAPYWADKAPDGPQGRRWQLWEYEVVELFLVGKGGDYVEFEFGPHGHYLALKLRAPRQIEVDDVPLEYVSHIRGNRWIGRSEIPPTLVPAALAKYNAFAIHGMGPKRRYLSHVPLPGPRPDFHQPDYFPSWP